MQAGVVGGYPVGGVRVTLFDGSYHPVDSSEVAFKLAAAQAMREALAAASPVLLEPVMLAAVTVPDDAVGDVVGDLNSRRGHPQGMEPAGGGMTEIRVEVPMAEMLSYSTDLRGLTAGRGEYTMELARYQEVPAHLVDKVVKHAGREPVGV
jgi:elongation factor G